MSDRERMALVRTQKDVVTEVLDDCDLQLQELAEALGSVISAKLPMMTEATIIHLKQLQRAMSRPLTR